MGKGSGGGTNTVTSSAPPENVSQAYDYVMGKAKEVSNQPLQQYGSPMVAGFTQDQLNSFQTVNNAQGMVQPYINRSANLIDQSAAPVTGADIAQYQNPYTQQVINATMAQAQQNDAQAQQGLVGNAIAQGAFGGDRAGVAQSVLAGQQKLANDQTVAGLNNQAYEQALAQANQQKGMGMQAASGISNLGNQAFQSTLTGAQAQAEQGALQQQLGQSILNVPYEQFQQQQQYPYQNIGWLSNIALGIGNASGMNTRSSETNPGKTLFARGGSVPHLASGGRPFNVPDASASFIPTQPTLPVARPQSAPTSSKTTKPDQQGSGLVQKVLAADQFGIFDAPKEWLGHEWNKLTMPSGVTEGSILEGTGSVLPGSNSAFMGDAAAQSAFADAGSGGLASSVFPTAAPEILSKTGAQGIAEGAFGGAANTAALEGQFGAGSLAATAGDAAGAAGTAAVTDVAASTALADAAATTGAAATGIAAEGAATGAAAAGAAELGLGAALGVAAPFLIPFMLLAGSQMFKDGGSVPHMAFGGNPRTPDDIEEELGGINVDQSSVDGLTAEKIANLMPKNVGGLAAPIQQESPQGGLASIVKPELPPVYEQGEFSKKGETPDTFVQTGKEGKQAPDPWLALADAGFALASGSGYADVANIGKAGSVGLKSWNEQKAAAQKANYENAKAEAEAKRLYGQAQSMGATGNVVQKIMADNPGMSFTQALQLYQTGMRQGITMNDDGSIAPMQGYGAALGQNKYGAKAGELSAEKDFAAGIKSEESRGKAAGDEIASYYLQLGQYPQLLTSVSDLNELGKKATYTKSGKLYDYLNKEFQGDPREASIASEQYTANVKNVLFPTLRATFGAQFTVKEGEMLLETLGSDSMSPKQKEAVLDSYIQQKFKNLKSAKSIVEMHGTTQNVPSLPEKPEPLSKATEKNAGITGINKEDVVTSSKPTPEQARAILEQRKAARGGK